MQTQKSFLGSGIVPLSKFRKLSLVTSIRNNERDCLGPDRTSLGSIWVCFASKSLKCLPLPAVSQSWFWVRTWGCHITRFLFWMGLENSEYIYASVKAPILNLDDAQSNLWGAEGALRASKRCKGYGHQWRQSERLRCSSTLRQASCLTKYFILPSNTILIFQIPYDIFYCSAIEIRRHYEVIRDKHGKSHL